MRPAGVTSFSLALVMVVVVMMRWYLIIITTTMSAIMVRSAGGALSAGSVIGVAYKMTTDSFESEAFLAASTR